MACYHPLKGFIKGYKDNGKYDLCIASYKVDHIEEDRQGKIYKVLDKNVNPLSSNVYRDFLDIPCGQCFGCRLERSRQWANRCSVELQNYNYNYFITLTYDNDNLPTDEVIFYDTGEIIKTHSLVKEDYQKFIRDLRYNYESFYKSDIQKGVFDPHIRYFGCGEYGDHSFRPHYHLIIYNLKIPDLQFYKRIEKADLVYDYYFSEWLDSIWKKGKVIVGSATWESIAYTARYVMKKLKGKEKEKYDHLGIIPEFCTMSRRPGIGREFYENEKEKIFSQDYIYLSSGLGQRKFTPPRYYRQLFDIDNPVESARIKEENKKFAEIARDMKLEKTSLSYLDLLEVEERNRMEKCKALTREL